MMSQGAWERCQVPAPQETKSLCFTQLSMLRPQTDFAGPGRGSGPAGPSGLGSVCRRKGDSLILPHLPVFCLPSGRGTLAQPESGGGALCAGRAGRSSVPSSSSHLRAQGEEKKPLQLQTVYILVRVHGG